MVKNIAVITDIHGNFSALKAVLSDIERESKVEHIYCLGDLIAIGHETNQVLEELRSRKDVSYVLGNHDEAILNILNGEEPGSQGEERDHHYWIAKNMNREFITFLSEMPKRLECMIYGKKILFLHYHLNECNQFLSIDTNPSVTKLDDLYKNEDVDIICFGHHHVLHYFKENNRIYLNPGALGCNSRPIATYATISIKDDGCVNCNVKEVGYNNQEFLDNYFRYDVPAKNTLLRIFHGNQDRNIINE
ncbi:metallophosphoesterase family protein [Viridibacillus arvi]|uniref:metallophosphoesterase family protein n=1 Tax=Viridibacillus arvi TaxID=263475 RepID=UPI0036E80A71